MFIFGWGWGQLGENFQTFMLCSPIRPSSARTDLLQEEVGGSLLALWTISEGGTWLFAPCWRVLLAPNLRRSRYPAPQNLKPNLITLAVSAPRTQLPGW